MSNVTYSAGNLTITVAGLDTVEQALGDLKRKTPAAAKVAINATARQARKLMVAKAKTRYAVNAAGRRHLKDLVQRKKQAEAGTIDKATKKRFVVELLEANGITVTPEIDAFIEAAVKELDLAEKNAIGEIGKIFSDAEQTPQN